MVVRPAAAFLCSLSEEEGCEKSMSLNPKCQQHLFGQIEQKPFQSPFCPLPVKYTCVPGSVVCVQACLIAVCVEFVELTVSYTFQTVCPRPCCGTIFSDSSIGVYQRDTSTPQGTYTITQHTCPCLHTHQECASSHTGHREGVSAFFPFSEICKINRC